METARVLFVCHGNICRSPMAQCVMQQLVERAGWADRFVIDSAATTYEEIGEPIYPPARRKLAQEGIPVLGHCARRIDSHEGLSWDYIVCMDEENIRHLKGILGAQGMDRVSKLMEHAGSPRDVADPWYTGDFDATYRDVDAGCRALLKEIAAERGWGVPA